MTLKDLLEPIFTSRAWRWSPSFAVYLRIGAFYDPRNPSNRRVFVGFKEVTILKRDARGKKFERILAEDPKLIDRLEEYILDRS